jgi:hypothetical protein
VASFSHPFFPANIRAQEKANNLVGQNAMRIRWRVRTFASPDPMLIMQIFCYVIAAQFDDAGCMSERLSLRMSFNGSQYRSPSYEAFWIAIASSDCMGPGCWDVGDQWVWETSEGLNGLCLDYFSLDKVDRISGMSS